MECLMLMLIEMVRRPTIGGQLSRPHDRWPNVFTHPFWIQYPYFLPCAAASAFSVICFVITVLYLKEVRSRSQHALQKHAL